MSETFVYFIKPVGMDGPIKIGFSTIPLNRLETLLPWSPFPLEIAAKAAGGRDEEKFLHSCFADLHSHKEWFKAAPRLISFVERVASAQSLDGLLDDLKPVGTIRAKRVVPEHLVGYASYNLRVWRTQQRMRARRLSDWNSPKEVWAILDRWHRGTRPTAEEFAFLDRYLADPVKHGEYPPQGRAAA